MFYNREDQWEVPTLDEGGGEARAMQPYYTIMRLPGEREAEFIQMLPFTPRRRAARAGSRIRRPVGSNGTSTSTATPATRSRSRSPMSATGLRRVSASSSRVATRRPSGPSVWAHRRRWPAGCHAAARAA